MKAAMTSVAICGFHLREKAIADAIANINITGIANLADRKSNALNPQTVNA